jgi:hypothetical protein
MIGTAEQYGAVLDAASAGRYALASLFAAAHCARGRAAGAADMTESRRFPADESS